MDYASGQMGAAFDLGVEKDELATQLRQQEDEKRKRIAMVGEPAADAMGASAMLLGPG